MIYILDQFNNDTRVTYVSINSRLKYATHKLLRSLMAQNLSYPIHFIFGLETLSPQIANILGKKNSGEFQRFITRLRSYNQANKSKHQGSYNFGLDVNLVFLPEIYLANNEKRAGNEIKIARGMKEELEQLLSLIDPLVPIEINLHPYYKVQELPYESLDLEFFMQQIPVLQAIIDKHNHLEPEKQTHLFIGMEGGDYSQPAYQARLPRWKEQIDIFNATGEI